jgi:hypothetical protein
MLHRFVHRGGGGGFAAGMRFGSLRRRCAEEYALLGAGRDGGEPYEQREMFVGAS